MRLTTWNCCAGPLSKKLPALASLRADIAVVPESPFLASVPGRAYWFGENPRRGLAVLARAPYRVEPVRPPAPLPRYVVPLQVVGPVSFLLLAVWAKGDRPHRYVRGVVQAVRLCQRLIAAQPTVAIGDFNSNTFWDAQGPVDQNHSALVRQLEAHGLVSAYHAHSGQAHGSETAHTYFQYRHADEPYHIDYGFVPASWLRYLSSVSLGSIRKWRALSDHVPLTLAFTGLAGRGTAP